MERTKQATAGVSARAIHSARLSSEPTRSGDSPRCPSPRACAEAFAIARASPSPFPQVRTLEIGEKSQEIRD